MDLTRRATLVGGMALSLPAEWAAPAPAGKIAPAVEAAARAASAQGFSGQVHLELDGRVALSKAWGRIAEGKAPAMTTRTRIHIASVSKSITATAMLTLIEAGRLALDEPISRFLPVAPADKAGITLGQLMEHSSGLPNAYAADGNAERDAAVAAVLAGPLKFAPGADTLYSNDNYALLAAVIEIASREDYATYVRRKVLAPAGMTRTRFWAEIDPRTARDVARIEADRHGAGFTFDNLGHNWGYIGSGGIWSTAAEVAAFVRAVAAGRILTPDSVRTMQLPRGGARGPSRFTYGWFIREGGGRHQLIWTRGTEDWGHNAVAYWWPQRRVLLTLTSNAGQHEGLAWSRHLGEALEPVIFDRLGGELIPD